MVYLTIGNVDSAQGNGGQMRIAHVVESLDRGGLERVVCDLVHEQRRQGDDAIVMCLFHRGALAGELDDSGIQVLEIGKRQGLDVRALWRLRCAISKSGADVVHTHNPVANYYVCAARLMARRQPPVINTRHNMGALDPLDRREVLFRLSIPRTTRLAMVSEQVSRHFVGSGIVPLEKARVVVNGIPIARYIPAGPTTRMTARARIAIDAAAVVAGTVGRLASIKNHRLLIDSFADVAAAVPELILVIVGDGPLRGELESTTAMMGIANRVRFLGERSDIPEILPAFDMFVLPSISEGHSIALLEAATCGLASIATQVGGNPEIVDEQRTGLLVPSLDRAALAAALLELASDSAKRTAFGANARQWATQTVSIGSMATNYRRVYMEALGVS